MKWFERFKRRGAADHRRTFSVMVFPTDYNRVSMAAPDTLPAIAAPAPIPPVQVLPSGSEPDAKQDEQPMPCRPLDAVAGGRLSSIDRSLLICRTADGSIELLPEGSVQTLPTADFPSDAAVLDCASAGEVVAQVAVDRSDAKITIRNIRLGACVVHAEWLCEEFGQ